MSSVPSVAATNSGTIGGMPMWTPPLTPAYGQGTHSASSSVSGIVNIPGWRESESEKEDAGGSGRERKKREAGAEVEGADREGKRRRVAPTLVSAGGGEVEMDTAGASGPEEVDASTPTALTS